MSRGVNSNSMVSAQVVTTAAAKKILSANSGRMFAEIINLDASISIYIGSDSSVTTGNGHLLGAGKAFGIDNYVGELWAIPASGTPSISTIEW